ncbi:hypothetical protein SteCoe_8555 [Stentor coeruleus]|uniref:Uncharacterized protein n=1 Tax=Stentor coeruleus TaxID=5963 RepID=A0A1R2CK75_9CILI|nr:hypothetical protein SteCoe_8555 [Stentor coeruleus]
MEKSIQELWAKVEKDYLTLSDESEDSFSDLSFSQVSSPQNCLVQIYTIFKDLIGVKNNFFMLKDYEDFLDNNQYQESLQKLEAEVRNHIKVEQQLKLFIESQQSRLEEMDKTFSQEDKETIGQIEMINKENKELALEITKKEAEIAKIRNGNKTSRRNEYLLLQQNSFKDSEKIMELEKMHKKLIESCVDVEASLEKQKIMCNSLKQENTKLREFVSIKNKSAERERIRHRNRLIIDRSTKNLFEGNLL